MKRPSPSQSASATKEGTIKQGNDGNMWIVKKTANGVHRWVPYKKPLKVKGKAYTVHDNGGRPFKVFVTKTEVVIFAETDEERKEYNKRVLTIKDYSNIFIGRGTGAGWQVGNSILVEVKPGTYVFIGWNVYSFKINEVIKKYVSPIGNSDVPYPYAIGTKNTYLMTELVKLDNDEFSGDPYKYYYFDLSKSERKKVPKYKVKMIHKRLY